MAESLAITSFGGYVITGFCILGAAVMIGFLRALMIEGWKERPRRELVRRNTDEVEEEQ